jgi:predicted TIM-barrel fold metal-dependent hydrolase
LDHVRFCFSKLEGPPQASFVGEWFDQMDKADLLLFSSNYPYWSVAETSELPDGLRDDQRDKILRRNADDFYKLGLFAPAA